MKIEEWDNSNDEKTECLKLVKSIFKNSDSTTSDYFDWIFRKNPYGKSIVMLAKDELVNDKVIGIEPITTMNLIINGEEVIAALSLNSAVDIQYRGKGIFSKILGYLPEKASENNIECIFGVSNDNSLNSFLRNGFSNLGKLPLLIKPIKISKKFNQPLRTIISCFDYIWKPSSKNEFGIEIFSKEFDYEFEKFILNQSERLGIFQKRSKEFLQWRYANHPTRKYETFVLRNHSRLVGYIIVRVTTIKNKKIGIILDFLIDSNEEKKEKFENLVNFALNYFWENNVSIAITTCRNELLENQILRKTGFFNCPSFLRPAPFFFIVNPLKLSYEKTKNLLNYNNWFFSFGDYDVF